MSSFFNLPMFLSLWYKIPSPDGGSGEPGCFVCQVEVLQLRWLYFGVIGLLGQGFDPAFHQEDQLNIRPSF